MAGTQALAKLEAALRELKPLVLQAVFEPSEEIDFVNVCIIRHLDRPTEETAHLLPSLLQLPLKESIVHLPRSARPESPAECQRAGSTSRPKMMLGEPNYPRA